MNREQICPNGLQPLCCIYRRLPPYS